MSITVVVFVEKIVPFTSGEAKITSRRSYYIYINIYIYMLAPPQDPYFYMLAFPKTYNTVHPVHLACLEAKYLVPEGFTVLRIFFFIRALPGSSC